MLILRALGAEFGHSRAGSSVNYEVVSSESCTAVFVYIDGCRHEIVMESYPVPVPSNFLAWLGLTYLHPIHHYVRLLHH